MLVELGVGIHSLNLNYNGEDSVHVIGEGHDTILTPANLALPALYAEDCAEIIIENLQVDGAGSDDPLAFYLVEHLLIRNVLVKDAAHRGIDVRSSALPEQGVIRIEGCEFEGMTLDPIFVGTAHEVWITNNLIWDSNDTAIDVFKGQNVYIEGNTILDAQNGIGLWNTASVEAVITNNIVTGVRNVGIIVQDATRWSVADNIVEGTGDRGIYIEAGDGQVVNNRVYGFTGNVIRLMKPNVLVADNIVQSDGTNGVYSDCSELRIDGNTFIGGLTNAIRANLGTDLDVVSNRIEGAVTGIRLQGCAGSVVARNNFYEADAGIRLDSTTYTVVESNVMYRQTGAESIVETGSAGYNRIRRNLVKDAGSIIIISAETVAVDNDWMVPAPPPFGALPLGVSPRTSRTARTTNWREFVK